MFNFRVILLEYIIGKENSPVTIMFNDIAYDVDPEDFCIDAAPLTGAVFKRYNVKVHKFLKSLTQGTKYCKCIEKSKVVRDDMKALRYHYNGSSKGERRMNITKSDLREL